MYEFADEQRPGIEVEEIEVVTERAPRTFWQWFTDKPGDPLMVEIIPGRVNRHGYIKIKGFTQQDVDATHEWSQNAWENANRKIKPPKHIIVIGHIKLFGVAPVSIVDGVANCHYDHWEPV